MNTYYFVLLLLALATTTLANPVSQECIIIGCGFAGAGALRTSRQLGLDCLLVEAQSECGGITVQQCFQADNNGDGEPDCVDTHAKWIAGEGVDREGRLHPVKALADDIVNFKYAVDNFVRFSSFVDNGDATDPDWFRYEDCVACVGAKSTADRKSGAADIDLQDAFTLCGCDEAFFNTDAGFLALQGEHIFEYAHVPRGLSLQASYPLVVSEIFTTNKNRFVSDTRGFSEIAKQALRDPGFSENDADILYNHKVTHIDIDNQLVTVENLENDAVTVYNYTVLFNSMSTAVVQHDVRNGLQGASLFSGLDQQFVDNLQNFAIYPQYYNVFFQFPDTFKDPTPGKNYYNRRSSIPGCGIWQNLNRPGFYQDTHIWSVTCFFEPQNLDSPIVTGNDEEVYNLLYGDFLKQFPGSPPPLSMIRPDYDNELSRGGGYPNFPFGTSDEIRRAVSTFGQDRGHYFIGQDHCFEQWGFTHGAYATGEDMVLLWAERQNLIPPRETQSLCDQTPWLD